MRGVLESLMRGLMHALCLEHCAAVSKQQSVRLDYLRSKLCPFYSSWGGSLDQVMAQHPDSKHAPTSSFLPVRAPTEGG